MISGGSLIGWLAARGIEPLPVRGGAQPGLRHELRINGDLHLSVFHDPLRPQPPIRICAHLAPLPADPQARAAAEETMLDRNRALVSKTPFGLRLSDSGDMICLAGCSHADWRSQFALFLAHAHALRKVFAHAAAPPPDPGQAIRYI